MKLIRIWPAYCQLRTGASELVLKLYANADYTKFNINATFRYLVQWGEIVHTHMVEQKSTP